MATFLLKETSL